MYNPYPKLPKNIRQIGERDQIVKLYVEDYVNTYLKRLYPAGGQDLRVGLLLGETRTQDGIPYLFVDGALEMEGVTKDGEKVEFTEEAWNKAYQTMEQMFPKRNVLGWFLCGAPGSSLSPLNYWKQHSQYFSGKNQLMYLNCGLEGEEALYIPSEDGFYKLRGYCIYYERNQMMQDYMVSRKDARRVESGTRDVVIRDFRQKMEDRKAEAGQKRTTVGNLRMACGVLSVAVLACGVVMVNNYQKMKDMETVIASAVPEGSASKWASGLTKGISGGTGMSDKTSGGDGRRTAVGAEGSDELDVEEVPGEVYPTLAEIVIDPGEGDTSSGADGQAVPDAAAAAAAEAGQAAQGAEPAAADPGSSADAPAVDGADPAASAPSVPKGLDQPAPEKSESSAPEEPAQPVQVPADAVRHVVKNGETLYGICMERYHSIANLEEICRWNGLSDENRISEGQELLLPAS